MLWRPDPSSGLQRQLFEFIAAYLSEPSQPRFRRRRARTTARLNQAKSNPRAVSELNSLALHAPVARKAAHGLVGGGWDATTSTSPLAGDDMPEHERHVRFQYVVSSHVVAVRPGWFASSIRVHGNAQVLPSAHAG